MITTWDRTIFIAINHHLKSPLLDFLMPRVSDLGLGHIQVIALLILALIRGRRMFAAPAGVWRRVRLAFGSQKRWLVPLLLAFALSGIGATVFKHTVQRDRPYWFYTHDPTGRELNVRVFTVPSRRPLRVRGFLSGHTATSVALATAATILLWPRKRRWLIAGIWPLAVVISLSRVYLADHWPLDVAAGTILGVLCGFAAVWLCRSRIRSGDAEPESDPTMSPNLLQRAAGTA